MIETGKDRSDWSRADAKTDAEIEADTATDPAWDGISETWYENACVVAGAASEPGKREVSLRLDADVLAFFESTGANWQARVNAVLRRFMSSRA